MGNWQEFINTFRILQGSEAYRLILWTSIINITLV
jgi:hypothetical protein